MVMEVKFWVNHKRHKRKLIGFFWTQSPLSFFWTYWNYFEYFLRAPYVSLTAAEIKPLGFWSGMAKLDIMQTGDLYWKLQPDLSGNPFLRLEKLGQKDWERKAEKLPKLFINLKPIFPTFCRDKWPSQDPADLLTLRHIYGFEFRNIEVFQQSCQLVEVVFFGN